MTQSLVVHEDIRKNINMIDDIQHHEVDEALGDLVKKAPKDVKQLQTTKPRKGFIMSTGITLPLLENNHRVCV